MHLHNNYHRKLYIIITYVYLPTHNTFYLLSTFIFTLDFIDMNKWKLNGEEGDNNNNSKLLSIVDEIILFKFTQW